MKVTKRPGSGQISQLWEAAFPLLPGDLQTILIMYSKNYITQEYKEDIVWDQEGYKEGWQGMDHRVGEEGEKSNSLHREDLGTGVSGIQQGR